MKKKLSDLSMETINKSTLDITAINKMKKLNKYLSYLIIIYCLAYFVIFFTVSYNKIISAKLLSTYPMIIYSIGIITIILFKYKPQYKLIYNLFYVLITTLGILEPFLNVFLSCNLIPKQYTMLIYPFFLCGYLLNIISGIVILNFEKHFKIVSYVHTVCLCFGLFIVFNFIMSEGIRNVNLSYVVFLAILVSLYSLSIAPEKTYLKYLFINPVNTYLRSIVLELVSLIVIILFILWLISKKYMDFGMGISLFALISLLTLYLGFIRLGIDKDKQNKEQSKLKTLFKKDKNFYEIIIKSLGETIVYIDENKYIQYQNNDLKLPSYYLKEKELDDKLKLKCNKNNIIYIKYEEAKNSHETLDINISYKKDEENVVLTGWITPIYYQDYFKGCVLSLFNITSSDHSETMYMKKIIEEKNILLSEIHHRVKNNLQVISSLISLQSNSVEDKNTKDILKESQLRIKSMGIVHETFYKTQKFQSIKFTKYINSLINEIKYAYTTKQDINFIIEIKDYNSGLNEIELNIDETIPLGLIINEFITNSIKYAFPHNKGTINIKFYKKENEYTLILKDNGIGFDNKTTNMGLGMNLIDSLTIQLQAKKEMNTDSQTCIKLTYTQNS